MIGYEIISKYKVFLENDYNNNDSYDYLKVKDLKTGIVYDEDSNENLAYILEIYNDIEWYLKVLIERYLKNK